ncbi:2-oxo acid dehydrogenase subunit E2 [Halomarina pelagica]|uniref:2-oxo acid dehydrogenase subunit E2 n=1 Tax=Halomarina pelagica TaxID=2961599 RepID=UPI0020C2C172|nr:2-oxo acid dehydrogenase subunit E2 [Halomarina sp. BND7]
MAYIVRMPKLGLEMEGGALLEWRVEEGASVTEGDAIAEIESEKTTAEVDARESGVLRTTFLAPGDEVPPGTPMGIVAESDEDIADLEAEAGAGTEADADGEAAASEPKPAEGAAADASEGTAEDAAAAASGPSSASERAADGSSAARAESVRASPRARKRADELDVELSGIDGTGPGGAITEDDVETAVASNAGGDAGASADVRASPRAKRRAEELGVDLATIEGTGPQGSITEDDVESAAESPPAAAGPEGLTLSEERPFDGMRRTIARRLGESYREAVHVTEHRTVDAEDLLAAREASTEALGVDVSLTDILLIALSAALDEHPAFNAHFEDDTHRLYAEHNLCLAVDVEAGLIAPVLRDVGNASLADLADRRRELTERVLAGDYSMDDLTGGTFTVTNLGVLGVESFDPVINPPQVAILGVNALDRRPMAEGKRGVAVRRVLPLDLSFDHRVVDGADAARFLETLVGHLEDPWPLLPEAVERPEGSATLDLPEREVSARMRDGTAGTVSVGPVAWDFDVPADLGGGGTAPTPVDAFLGSLAACVALAVRMQADRDEVPLDDVDVRARGSPERGWLERVDVTVVLDADADDETLRHVVDLGRRNCYVVDALDDDVDLGVSWRRA